MDSNSEIDDLDFSDFWSNSGVSKEVLRGVKIRKAKSNYKYESEKHRPLDINVDVNTHTVKKQSYKKINLKTLYQNCNPSYCKTNISSTLTPRFKTQKRYKLKSKTSPIKIKSQKCSMRIAELAVPSKRQCLDTWRNRGKMLPNIMVDRLRQHVMDQKPVIHINDAINCFKSRRLKDYRHIVTSPKTTNKNITRAKLFCALFGHRITMKLLPSRCTPIQTDLKSLCDVINEEITELLRNGKKIYQNKKIQDNVSDMAALWVVEILEDSYMKLMMDDLYELEEKEGHIWDIIDDVLEAVSISCKSKSISNIENQENSTSYSSSFISINSNNTNIINEYTEFIGSIKDETNEMIDDILSDIINEICSNDTQTLDDFIQSVIGHVLSEIINDQSPMKTRETIKLSEKSASQELFDLNLIEVDSKIIPTNEIQSPIKEDMNDNSTIYQNHTQHNFINKIRSSSGQENIESMEKNSQEIILNNNNVVMNPNNLANSLVDDDSNLEHGFEKVYENNPETSKLSDNLVKFVAEITDLNKNKQQVPTEEETLADNKINLVVMDTSEHDDSETPDDSFKKVKFSDINIGIEKPLTDAENQKYNADDDVYLNKKLSSSSSRNYLKYINFSPPNTHLLCNVDEKWPEDFLPLTTKLSAYVSKSVTSLGFIKEGDEDLIHSSGTNRNKETTKQHLVEKFVAELSNSNEGDSKEIIDLRDAVLPHLDVKNPNITANKYLKNKNLFKKSNNSTLSKLIINDEINYNKEKIKYTKDAVSQYINTDLKTKILPSVTIDSELLVESYKKGFIAEKPTQTEVAKQKRTKLKYKQIKINQHELHIWCKGLNNVIVNLENWLKWIEDTHNLVTQLRDTDNCMLNTRKLQEDNLKNWMKLKECIDCDAKLWRKLYANLTVGLNRYKNFYENKNKIKSPYPKLCLCYKDF